ncbi:MAG: DUF2079 domain-containing protein [Cyanophyceae cyanobacterium]
MTAQPNSLKSLFKLKSVNFASVIPQPLALMISFSSVVLFAAASLRHWLLQSTAFDLAIYDQVAYLMGRGLLPYATVSDMHHMGNHAAYSFYLVGLLYALVPSVHWLFGVQAIALSLGAWPTWALARQAGLSQRLSLVMGAVYLLYPLVFNVNLFDFHPEVMVIAAMLGAIWAARSRRMVLFSALIVYVLGGKAVLSLTVLGLGIWLVFFERRQWYGAIALTLSSWWFLTATQVVIPMFNNGEGHDAVGRYSYLGSSVLEVAKNTFLRPDLVFGQVLSLDTVVYLVLVSAPLIWWLLAGRLGALVATVPAVGLNILSMADQQRDLVHQYSLPILPFLIVAAIAGLKHSFVDSRPGGLWRWVAAKYPGFWARLRTQVQGGWVPMAWALVCFVALAKFGYFGSIYVDELDTWAAANQAIAQVTTKGGVLTTAEIAPHLSHRETIRQIEAGIEPNWDQYEYVLLNLRHPGQSATGEFSRQIKTTLDNSDVFDLAFEESDVLLFRRVAGSEASPRKFQP